MARTAASGGVTELQIQNSTHTFAVDAEASDAYAITLTPAVTSYVTGQRFAFKANTANTGGSSLNVNGLGAKTILKHSNAALANNDIKANSIVEVYYDGTDFQMVSMLSNAPAGGGDMAAATYDPAGVARQLSSQVITTTSGATAAGAQASTHYVYLVAGAHVVTLPTAVSNTALYSIKNNHSADITISTTSSQTIDGAVGITVAPEDSVTIISNNTNWNII